MSAMSDYLEVELLDHALGTTSWTMPTAVYVKLHTGSPGDDGTTNAATETTRKVVTFAAAAGGAAQNNSSLNWASYPAAETISHVSLWDASTAGNCLFVIALASSSTLSIGDTFNIPITGLMIQFR